MPTLKKTKKPLAVKETKNTFSRSQPSPKLTAPEAPANNETQFWNEVEECSQNLIANLIEKVLPISAIPSVFDLEKDTDYRVLLRDDLPNFYQDNEEYLAKIESGNWTPEDVEYVAQDLTCQYFSLVVSALVERLSDYQGFESTGLTNLEGI